MAAEVKTRLEIRSMIPIFQLMSAENRTVNIWDYKGRNNLVLAFLPAHDCPVCLEFLHTASNAYHLYKGENAELLAIVSGSVDEAAALRNEVGPPFPVLYDDTGAVTARYTDRVPAVFVADTFGELYAQWILPPGGPFPTQKEILDFVELINLECPECGAPLDWR